MRFQLPLAAAVAAVVVTAWIAHKRGVWPSEDEARQFEAVPIDGAVGPESFAFDPRGGGPYTGVSDGRIIKWDRTQNRWYNFSVICSHRMLINIASSNSFIFPSNQTTIIFGIQIGLTLV
ncbi:Protein STRICTOSIDINE SYNTHASE-LIKE 2, partial [Mucuna pruriens]